MNWTKSELAELGRKTRKLLTIQGVLHPRSNVSRLYLPRREGGRGLISAEDAINTEEKNYQCLHQPEPGTFFESCMEEEECR